MAADASSPTYTCNQTPPFSHVQLLTNTGSYEVGKACIATNYMGFTFDYAGITDYAIPAGSYVISADLMATDGLTSLSSAPGPGSQYQIGSCDPLTVAFTFDLN